MPYQYVPPKYARVIEELQRRIEAGDYPPGTMLPSEHQLSDEFQVARPTVVRALRVLRQDGWIGTEQGKGSFVRGRPALAGLQAQRTGESALGREESREPADRIEVGTAKPPARVAELLEQAGEDRVLTRRQVVRYEGEPSELVTWWIPAALAEGTGLADPRPLDADVLTHLSRHRGTRVDHVLEQVIARHPTSREARLLLVDKSTAMLVMYMSARDATGTPILVLELVMPGDRHVVEDVYQMS
jgi:DNA-binding GntR family transcriptional regulator